MEQQAVHKTPFDSEVIRRYTNGGCFCLARRITELIGKSSCRIADIHGGVVLDEEQGLILDVSGVWKKQDWLSKWTLGLAHGDDYILMEHKIAVTDKCYKEQEDLDHVAVTLIAWARNLGYVVD